MDYNATTPVDPRVVEVMLPYFSEKFGNAASRTHSFGWIADEAVKEARENVSKLIGASAQEIVFTSGSTEAINMAIKGVFASYIHKGKHIITAATEHEAVLDTCKQLKKKGAEITVLPVDRDGLISPELLKKTIREDTILVCIMYGNNETGTIHPIEELGKISHEANTLFMTDATQAAGKTRIDVHENHIDLLCLSSHKLYGPKGCGAIYIRKQNPRVKLIPLIDGGSHENGMRAGTLNVPGIVGFGKACEIAFVEMWNDAARISRLRTILEQGIIEASNIYINGSIRNRLPNVSNLSIQGIDSAALIPLIKEVAVSTGSACTSDSMAGSHVLSAMNVSEELIRGSLRFSLGKYTTEEEVLYVVELVKRGIHKLRIET